MANEVEIYEPGELQPSELTVTELIERRDKIKDAMTRAMTKGVHYGTIPGVKKPSLWKPGAELLCSLFLFDPEYDSVTSTDDEGHFHVKSKCTLFHIPTSNRVSSGEGYCSTGEKQYRNVASKPDIYNTIVKMANKRALVAAVLNAVAASDVFTQDVEDNAPSRRSNGESTAPAPNASAGVRAELQRELTLNAYAPKVWSEQQVIVDAANSFGRQITSLDDLTDQEARTIAQVARDWREAHPPPNPEGDTA